MKHRVLLGGPREYLVESLGWLSPPIFVSDEEPWAV
jgi:hypothetical protein